MSFQRLQIASAVTALFSQSTAVTGVMYSDNGGWVLSPHVSVPLKESIYRFKQNNHGEHCVSLQKVSPVRH